MVCVDCVAPNYRALQVCDISDYKNMWLQVLCDINMIYIKQNKNLENCWRCFKKSLLRFCKIPYIFDWGWSLSLPKLYGFYGWNLYIRKIIFYNYTLKIMNFDACMF